MMAVRDYEHAVHLGELRRQQLTAIFPSGYSPYEAKPIMSPSVQTSLGCVDDSVLVR